MPELPETETIARDLQAQLAGVGISRAEVVRPDVLRGVGASELITRLAGATIQNVRRRAKSVVFELTVGALVVTPRFTGILHLRPIDSTADPYDALRLDLGTRILAYRDVRRLGTVQLYSPAELRAFEDALGPEPLAAHFTTELLSGILRVTSAPIKKTLMTPARLAGVGNIYANEVLWDSRIDPSRPANSLSLSEVRALHMALQRILADAVVARGTTFRDYRDANNERGGYAERLQAYGRGGSPCQRCGTVLVESHAIDGRSTVFCFRCQR